MVVSPADACCPEFFSLDCTDDDVSCVHALCVLVESKRLTPFSVCVDHAELSMQACVRGAVPTCSEIMLGLPVAVKGMILGVGFSGA